MESMLPKNQVTLSRQKIGCRTGSISLISNIFLFVGKLIVGIASNSVAVLADSFNNLTDCVSSIVTIIGFRLSGRAKDKNHPYGHGRMEYISGFIISMLIIVTAVSFGKVALLRIINPQQINVSPVLLLVTALAVVVKLALAFYTKYRNKSIHSVTLAASMKDSFSDALVTSITLLSLVVTPFTSFPLDGFIGLAVTGFILWSGITSFLENLNLLLGKGVNSNLSNEIKATVLTRDVFSNIESIEVHDYGPETRISTIQVSLNQSPHTAEVQNAIKEVNAELKEKFGLENTVFFSISNSQEHGQVQAKEAKT